MIFFSNKSHHGKFGNKVLSSCSAVVSISNGKIYVPLSNLWWQRNAEHSEEARLVWQPEIHYTKFISLLWCHCRSLGLLTRRDTTQPSLPNPSVIHFLEMKEQKKKKSANNPVPPAGRAIYHTTTREVLHRSRFSHSHKYLKSIFTPWFWMSQLCAL